MEWAEVLWLAAVEPMSRPKRCAIYTRKSTEEGLEQDFNSLDAQREACAAFIQSQRSEGWRAITGSYDDGGYSGGSMERPDLQRLMADIDAGKVDVVVVYKIDRLTRSLADFARMVEAFDRHCVSFVSVTQAFNTTTSMGRLTLNVLLSFAQFEREVTGERIRDKVQASKAKGMWMGGILPLGYDLPNQDRALRVNPAEAETVRHIFRTYLELGSVHLLERRLDDEGVRSKRWTTRSGKTVGGQRFSRGALFHLLRNRTYLGTIPHKNATYPGMHPAIVDADLFKAVKAKLDANARRRATTPERVAKASLSGRIFDADGQRMSPTFSYGKQGRLYRYYVSTPLQRGRSFNGEDDVIRRVSAPDIEALLRQALARLIPRQRTDLLDSIKRVEIRNSSIHVLTPISYLTDMQERAAPDVKIKQELTDPTSLRLVLSVSAVRRGGRTHITPATDPGPKLDQNLIRALREAHAMVERDARGYPILQVSPASSHKRRQVRLAFLAPELQQAILEGRQPPELTLKRLMQQPFPAGWDAQIKCFGAPIKG